MEFVRRVNINQQKIKIMVDVDKINEMYRNIREGRLNRTIGMQLTDGQKAMQENRKMKKRIEELEQRSEPRPHETIVIFDTSEKVEEGALLLARIRQISQDQLSSEQVKRMNELIKATGFELHYRK